MKIIYKRDFGFLDAAQIIHVWLLKTIFRAIISEKEGKNAETALSERFEMSIYEKPIGNYFKFKLQEYPWRDENCKLQYSMNGIH